jgi:hypothetical protein
MIGKLAVICLLVVALRPTGILAADLSALYADAELGERKARYEPRIRWNFENLILGSLTPAERSKLGEVRLVLPLRGQGALRGHPMAYYAGGKTVVVPIMSVKFFDDLTLAFAYFSTKGLNLEPVADYVGMLKYRSAADIGGRFPPPLEALGLSYDIWKTDKKVDDVSQQALKSGLVWIMAHELGHISHGHRGYADIRADDAQRQEAAADAFANRIMRRIGVPPIGMPIFFTAMAHLEPSRGDFQSNDAWTKYLSTKATHPLTADRMVRWRTNCLPGLAISRQTTPIWRAVYASSSLLPITLGRSGAFWPTLIFNAP